MFKKLLFMSSLLLSDNNPYFLDKEAKTVENLFHSEGSLKRLAQEGINRGKMYQKHNYLANNGTKSILASWLTHLTVKEAYIARKDNNNKTEYFFVIKFHGTKADNISFTPTVDDSGSGVSELANINLSLIPLSLQQKYLVWKLNINQVTLYSNQHEGFSRYSDTSDTISNDQNVKAAYTVTTNKIDPIFQGAIYKQLYITGTTNLDLGKLA